MDRGGGGHKGWLAEVSSSTEEEPLLLLERSGEQTAQPANTATTQDPPPVLAFCALHQGPLSSAPLGVA